ncbi:sugar transferase [Sulfurirhabdus autotrophica]|uniref:Sugar transferase EpsL n=1 Tax=Sulfurirhabdus autotrophica TaxID=1706046 RepID=A0A4V6P3U6_9PROT|nr:sugar transferase [Sulfurirhabdus autotrophica]TCV84279.1 sugar transferase EpsL [Sulfurirhabdus autotrophica]
MIKRFLDMLSSLILLILFSPVMVVVAILVQIFIGSPFLFKQLRPGKNAKPFYLYKFRTMSNERNGRGEFLPDEYRLQRFGKILRRLSLDELPQLINVLKGDMSLVGPRPLLMEYLSLYSADQARRHDVRPGITGWAQVNGRNAISWEERFKLDVWYVDHQSLLLDLKIFWLTVMKVLRSEGVNQEGHVTMEKFAGNARNDVR